MSTETDARHPGRRRRRRRRRAASASSTPSASLARLFLGAVLIYAGAAKVGHPLTVRSARCRPTRCFPMDLAGWIGLALPFVEIVLGRPAACSACSPGPSADRLDACSWWRSSSASRRPGPAA